jgi:UDP-N-acetylglucosamine 2-epimerase (non-hydrolysing)
LKILCGGYIFSVTPSGLKYLNFVKLLLDKLKLLFCIGTRPEAIKMAPVIHEFIDQGALVEVCLTGQHRELLNPVIEWFKLPAHYNLELMSPDQQLNKLASKIIHSIDIVLEHSKPDLIFVQGDTTTASMAALSSFHRKIKIAHIEAGLRTQNLKSPFPEEMNRQLISRIADFHFAPTERAVTNLSNEGITENVTVTGNTVVDALIWSRKKLSNGISNTFITTWEKKIKSNSNWILVTMHRRENFGQGLAALVKSASEIVNQTGSQIIWPIHPNPNIKDSIPDDLMNHSKIHIVEPLDYPSMIWLMSKVSLIISDSGGIQEEAPSFGVPVIVTRETTERMEGLEQGTSFLIGKNDDLTQMAKNLLNGNKSQKAPNPYGDGQASKRIVAYINQYFS